VEVQHDHELVDKQAQKTADLGEVGKPDVVDVPGSEHAGFRTGTAYGLWRSRGPAVPADGFAAYFDPCPGEHLCDLLAPSDVESIEHLNQTLDNIVVTAERRFGSDERSDGLGLGLGQRLAFPARNGLRIDEEDARGLGPAETVGSHQDHYLEPFPGGVVLPLPSREALQASPHDLGHGALLLELHLNQHTLGKACPDRVTLSPPPREHMSKTQRHVPGAPQEEAQGLGREVASTGGNRNVRVGKSIGRVG